MTATIEIAVPTRNPLLGERMPHLDNFGLHKDHLTLNLLDPFCPPSEARPSNQT